MVSEEISSQILCDLGEIKAGQKHLQEDMADIKTEIREIKQTNEAIDARVRTLETVQAECRGKHAANSSAFSKLTALISGAISAGVALVVALITTGRI